MTWYLWIILFFLVLLAAGGIVELVKIAWPHVPLLPGLFEDMGHGYSYDKDGNRVGD